MESITKVFPIEKLCLLNQHFAKLPGEILVRLVSYLRPINLVMLTFCSYELYNYVQNDEVLKRYLSVDVGVITANGKRFIALTDVVDLQWFNNTIITGHATDDRSIGKVHFKIQCANSKATFFKDDTHISIATCKITGSNTWFHEKHHVPNSGTIHIKIIALKLELPNLVDNNLEYLTRAMHAYQPHKPKELIRQRLKQMMYNEFNGNAHNLFEYITNGTEFTQILLLETDEFNAIKQQLVNTYAKLHHNPEQIVNELIPNNKLYTIKKLHEQIADVQQHQRMKRMKRELINNHLEYYPQTWKTRTMLADEIDKDIEKHNITTTNEFQLYCDEYMSKLIEKLI